MKATIIINGVCAEVTLTPEQEELFNPKQFGRQRVMIDNNYFFVSGMWDIEEEEEMTYGLDDARFERGNYFPSFAKAQAHDNYTLAVVKVNDRIDQLNKGWKMVWDTDKAFYAIYYSHDISRFETYAFTVNQFSLLIKSAASKVIAEQIIDEMEKELTLIFNIT